jgi:hypothetical protein
LAAASARIAHLKILLACAGGKLKMSLTSNAGELSVEGAASSCDRATLVVNARVQADPKELRAIVERCLKEAAGNTLLAEIVEITSFRPNRPNPVHRFTLTTEARAAD